ncbi:MAG: hypothetical protein AAFU79_13770 [Myxococcota bacterium]
MMLQHHMLASTPPPELRASSSELDARMAALAQDPNDLEGFRRAHAAFRAAARRLPPSASAEVEVRLRNLAFLADGPGLLELWREYGGRLR